MFVSFCAFLAVMALNKNSLFETKLARVQHQLTGSAQVTDGDSIIIKGQRIRLKGIDAPELKQLCYKYNKPIACGQEAREHLIKLINERPVTCYYDLFDKYRRALGVCFVKEMNLNRTMVIDGYAVNYYDYPKEQRYAKQEKHGIWQYRFMRPYKWRREQRAAQN